MNDELFQDLITSVREGGSILRGEAQPARSFQATAPNEKSPNEKSPNAKAPQAEGPDVRAIRERYQLSQPEFAALLGISVGTLRNWEQGRRAPEGPARVLLRVAARHPQAVWDVVRPHHGKATSKHNRRARSEAVPAL
jgi:putative transcriptional regulator